MIVSMTGYGRSEKESETNFITVEIRAVNHRYFDFHIRMPQQYLKMEEKIKKICQKYINRGRVDCYINIEGINITNRTLAIDWNLIDEYYQFIKILKDRYQLHNEIKLTDFLAHNELVTITEKEDVSIELEAAIIQSVEEAVQNLKSMRVIEGRELQKDIIHFLEQIEKNVQVISDLIPNVQKDYEEKLLKKITEFTNGIIDDSRVLTEVAIFSERADISEEITRLKSHIQQFRGSMEENTPVGRKFDFLVQEMNREVNTIGSKANSSEIAKIVVELKSIIEKIREQVQNIE